jgi:hypothetical protein
MRVRVEWYSYTALLRPPLQKPDSDLEIPFLFPNPLIEDGKASTWDESNRIIWDRRKFWTQDSTSDWFKAQGFVLYKSESGGWTESDPPLPQLPDPDFVQASYPFAFHSSYTPAVSSGKDARQGEDLPNVSQTIIPQAETLRYNWVVLYH